VIHGLTESPKRLACKYFYDQQGSELFDQICKLEEYYLSRTEDLIMEQSAAEMGEALGEDVMLIEYGSGSSIKTRHLLNSLQRPAAYVPVDISEEHLKSTAEQLLADFPQIEILPVAADFTQPFKLPLSSRPATHAAIYFPGSTIGNFEPQAAIELLHVMAEECGQGGGLLIGIDLQKDVEIIHAAYNDSKKVTDAFNLNVLHRVNRELNGTFDISKFRHDAFYDPEHHRVDIGLVSTVDQSASVDGVEFDFAAEERIHTEYSHKYSIEGFSTMAAEAGFQLRKSWTDANNYFAVLHFIVPATES
jgi:dimethylhistidine N-methyltransferase